MTAAAVPDRGDRDGPVPLPPRRRGLEAVGFVVGADGSATGASASGALAALGVVSGHLAAVRATGSAVG